MKLAAVIVALGACGGSQPPVMPPPAPTPVAAAVIAPAPVPPDAPPAPHGCDPAAPECTCDAGDVAACTHVADAAFHGGDRDLAIVTVVGLCHKDEPTGCLIAASYLDQLRIAERLGTTPAQLRARAVAIYDQRCTADSAVACLELGKLLFRGKEVAVDTKRAFELADRACTLGDARGCVMQAHALDARRDRVRRIALLERACDLGYANACTLFGDALADRKRAAALYDRACTSDDGMGCARSAGVFDRAGDHGRALELRRRACELDEPASCAAAGRSLVAADDAGSARPLYQHGCDLELGTACSALAELVAAGRGGARDWGAAIDLDDKACHLADRAGCAGATRLRSHPPDWRCGTADECTHLCNEQIAKSCTKLGRLLATTGGGCEAAAAAYTDGCDRGDGEGCRLLGNHAVEQRDAERSYARACTAKDGDGCVLRDAIRWSDGDDHVKPALAAALQRACATDQRACVWLASTLGAAPRAATILRTHCDGGDGRACRFLSLEVAYTAFSADDRDDDADRQNAKIRAPLRKGCELGDLLSCRQLTVAEGAPPDEIAHAQAAIRDAETNAPCAPDDLEWEQ